MCIYQASNLGFPTVQYYDKLKMLAMEDREVKEEAKEGCIGMQLMDPKTSLRSTTGNIVLATISCPSWRGREGGSMAC